MVYTFYDGTIVVTQHILGSLSHFLQQAEQHPNATDLLNARLREDMYPVTDQVRLATQFSENLVARLTGREPVITEGKPTTYAECYERIEKVLKALNEADRDIVDQHADKLKLTQLGPDQAAEVSGAIFAHTIALPNIYFHLTTAYGILRKEGVSLGKRDYYVGFSSRGFA
ncbi:hypothetical protein N7527_004661 [Penicillium freii]|uniref:DUF1993 domain-containing protein n=1 Tax=Penicillium freii TaxID=48697 RepID=A0A101M9H1_PENFR|nr:hypothetical protein N7527_004661 [Penicillium freii]KUM56464.1 hypothetical protein ACN42_g10745 [Penicillium freii]